MPLIISHLKSWQKEQRMSVLITEIYLEGTSGMAGEEHLLPLTVVAKTLHMYTHIYIHECAKPPLTVDTKEVRENTAQRKSSKHYKVGCLYAEANGQTLRKCKS